MALGDITNTSSSQPSTTDKMKPLHFLIALYPGFQLMDLAGPLDILNIISLPPFSQPIRLTFLASTLDPVPTKPVLPEDANYTYDFQALLGTNNLGERFNQWFTPQYTFESYLENLTTTTSTSSTQASEELKPDILFIPGGLGSRLRRLTPTTNGNTTSSLNVQDLIDWIPQVTPHLSTGIMTVCTGSDILARTGLLTNRRATTNMMRFDDVSGRHPNVNWVRGARWAKSGRGEGGSSTAGKDLEMWTSAGISAGMDLTLAFVAEYYGGMDVARDIARRLEYDWRETVEGGVSAFYGRYFKI